MGRPAIERISAALCGRRIQVEGRGGSSVSNSAEHLPATSADSPAQVSPRSAADWPFYLALAVLGGSYVVLIVALLAADVLFTTGGHIVDALNKPEIRYSIWLTMATCSLAAILSVW